MTTTDTQLLDEARTVIRATPPRLRTYGTPHPFGFARAAWVLVFVAAVTAIGAAFFNPWAALLGLLPLLLAASFGWSAHVSRGHEDEIRRYRTAHMNAQDISVRRHPLRWAVGVPAVIVLSTATHFARNGRQSGRAWLIALGAGLLFGILTSGYVQYHARRRR